MAGDIKNGLEQPGDDASAPKNSRKREFYQKPAFRFERVFETLALSCGKISGLQSQCRNQNLNAS